MREILQGVRRAGRRIGFVPTMGALHEGHNSLIRMARERTEYVVVSIYVNPRQFGPGEDLASYPRVEERDCIILEGLGCDLAFLPSDRELYSPSDSTRISVGGLSETLCGVFRSGHFDGVALVVAKLFNIVQPDIAFFGQKDAQQAVIIQRMTADLDFPVGIVLGPTVREPDGLAMSSRNSYLKEDERRQAAAIYGALVGARSSIEEGWRDPGRLKSALRRMIGDAGIEVEYAEIVDGATLKPVSGIEGTVLVAVAGRLGGTRLIDNIALRVTGDRVEEILLEFPEWSRYGG